LKTLGVGIDQQNLFSVQGSAHGEVAGYCCFAYAAFSISDGDYQYKLVSK
jgi:hypothetical protein